MHIIRLRGPWQLVPLERYAPQPDGSIVSATDDLPPATQAKLPAAWDEAVGRDFLGRVRYTRNFNRPTNLEPHERVWLVVEPPRSCGLVCLNGEMLGYVRFGSPPGRFDITPLLMDHNSVVIEVEHPELDDDGNAPDDASVFVPGGLVGEVRLEIQED